MIAPGPIVKATVNGRKHEIPDIWICGFITAGRARGEVSNDPHEAMRQAVEWWDYQVQLGEGA